MQMAGGEGLFYEAVAVELLYGQVVRYHGSKLEVYGLYLCAGACPCRCCRFGPVEGRLGLVPIAAGRRELYHVRPASVSIAKEVTS